MTKNLIVFAFILFNNLVNAQTNRLELKLEKGETYFQNSTAASTITQEIQGMDMKIDMNITGQTKYFVKDIVDNNYIVDVSYTRLQMEMKMPMGAMSMDSDNADGGDPFSSVMSRVTNKPFQVILTKKGKVIEVMNIEKLWEGAFDSMQDLPAPQLAQIKDQLVNAYGKEAFKGNLEMVTAIFPENSVAIDDSWKIETNLSAGMTGKLSSTYTLKNVTENMILISGDATISTEEGNDFKEMNGMEMKMDMTGTMTSKIKLDPKTGWITESNIMQDLEGVNQIKDNPQVPGGMEIPMKMTTESTIKGN